MEFKSEKYHFEVHNKSRLESPILLRVSGKPIILNKGENGKKREQQYSMLIYASKPKLVLVEEPEIHMHPVGLYTYLRFLLRLAKEMKFQTIMSTHSIELVQFVEEDNREAFKHIVCMLEKLKAMLKLEG